MAQNYLDQSNIESAQLVAIEVVSHLLSSTNPRELSQSLIEQLRELTGARTVMLVRHVSEPAARELISACPERRAGMFTIDEFELLCPHDIPKPLPLNPRSLPKNDPLRMLLLRVGVKSVLRFPLVAGKEIIGYLLIFDLPTSDRIDDAVKTITLLSPPIALALRNAIAQHKIERQAEEITGYARELEKRVEQRTGELTTANKLLETSRLAAENALKEALRDRMKLERMNVEYQRSENQLKEANTQLEAINQELLRLSEVKSQFLAVMSHEIRTPLNAVIGLTGLLLETKLDPTQLDYCETIRVSSEMLLSLINDILDYSKVEAGKMELENQPFELSHCVEEALELTQTKANEKNIDLYSEYIGELPPFFVGDIMRLRQILVNLLSNAIKFTDKGKVALSIMGMPHGRNQYKLQFSVRDTGRGIPVGQQHRLFQSFSQLDSSTTRQYGGTGLGLAICKRLVELMGGSICVKSSGVAGEGTTFHFFVVLDEMPDQQLPVECRFDMECLKEKKYLSSTTILLTPIMSPTKLSNWEALPFRRLQRLERSNCCDKATTLI